MSSIEGVFRPSSIGSTRTPDRGGEGQDVVREQRYPGVQVKVDAKMW